MHDAGASCSEPHGHAASVHPPAPPRRAARGATGAVGSCPGGSTRPAWIPAPRQNQRVGRITDVRFRRRGRRCCSGDERPSRRSRHVGGFTTKGPRVLRVSRTSHTSHVRPCGRGGSTVQRHHVEPPQQIAALELQLVHVAALVGDREVEAWVSSGAVHPAGVDAGDAVLAPPATERHRCDRAAVEVGTDRDGFIEGFAAHKACDDPRGPGRGGGCGPRPTRVAGRSGPGCPVRLAHAGRGATASRLLARPTAASAANRAQRHSTAQLCSRARGFWGGAISDVAARRNSLRTRHPA